MTRRWGRKVLVGGALLALVLGAVAASGVGAESQDVASVRQVFHDSQVAQQTLDVAPGIAALGGGTPPDAMVRAPLPAAAMNAWHSHIDRALMQLYAGERLAQIQQVMDSHATEQQAPEPASREVAGGVNSIQFRTLEVSGNTATVVARVDKWLEWATADHQGQIKTAVTRGVVNFQDTLVKTASGWRITAERFLSFGDDGATGP